MTAFSIGLLGCYVFRAARNVWNVSARMLAKITQETNLLYVFSTSKLVACRSSSSSSAVMQYINSFEGDGYCKMANRSALTRISETHCYNCRLEAWIIHLWTVGHSRVEALFVTSVGTSQDHAGGSISSDVSPVPQLRNKTIIYEWNASKWCESNAVRHCTVTAWPCKSSQ